MKVQDIYLSGNQTFLRSPVADDFGDTMVRWVNDREVTKFLSRGTFPGQLAAFQEEFAGLANSKTEIQLSICLKENSKYVGITGLHSINWIARSAEFRILIGEKDQWGKGIGTEALQMMTAYGFEILNFNKVWLGVNAANQKAYQSYLNGGFKEEGRLRQEVYRNGQYYDVIRMSLLRNEYEKEKESWKAFSQIKSQLLA